MNTSETISAYTLKALVEKLRPSRFPGMPPVVAAVVGFTLGVRFVDPAIAEIAVADDGRVLARADGEAAMRRVIGSYTDVLQNWLAAIQAAGLTRKEFMEAQSLFASKVRFFRPPSA